MARVKVAGIKADVLFALNDRGLCNAELADLRFAVEGALAGVAGEVNELVYNALEDLKVAHPELVKMLKIRVMYDRGI